MITSALFLLFSACGTEPSADDAGKGDRVGHGPRVGGPGGPRGRGGPAPGGPGGGPGGPGGPGGAPGGPGGGGGDLALPVDNPVWDSLHGLLDHPQEYGEANWDDVRMRVVGHAAVLGRDQARLAAMSSDWAGCAKAYTDSAAKLESIRVSGDVGEPIRSVLVAAARRDAGLCDALGKGTAPTIPTTGTVAPLRARWVALVVRGAHHTAHDDVRTDAAKLAADARAVVAPTGLDLDAFGSFEERHKLRVKLVEAWADAVSPFTPTEPFDYWTAQEVVRQAAGIAMAAAAVESGTPPTATAADALPPSPKLPYSAAELGSLVTGDSTVDTLGFAGPRAIGSLSRLGVDDAEHKPWLDSTAAALAAAAPTEVPAKVAAFAAELDRFPGGIRYYAIKQLKNTAVRHLARDGHYAEALAILSTNLPLHNQDWACPDRTAILTAIEARLRVLAHDPAAASTITRGLGEVDAFLAHAAEAEAKPGGGAPGDGPGRGTQPPPPSGP